MKKQRKILWRKGIHLAFSEKWNTGFGGFKKFFLPQHLCILKAKLARPATWNPQWKRLPCVKESLQTQEQWIQDGPRHEKTVSSVTARGVTTTVRRRKAQHFISSPRSSLKLQAETLLTSAGDFDHEYSGEKGLLKTAAGLPANSAAGQANGHGPRTEPQASDFPMKFNGEGQHPGESGKIVVTLSSHKRRRFCYGCRQGLERHRIGGLLSPKRFPFHHHRRVKVSPLMMYEKLSMIRFQYRVLRSQHFRAKSKVCKLRKAQQSWVQVTGDRETLRDSTEGGSHSPVPTLDPKELSCHQQPHPPDMDSDVEAKGKNCRVPDGHAKGSPLSGKEPSSDEAFPGHQNGSATDAWDQTPCSSPKWTCTELIHETPMSEYHPNPVCTSETSRDMLTLGPENGSNSVGIDKAELSVSSADGPRSYVDGVVSEETVGNESSCPMEEEGSLKQNILSSKLLDHPYCKSPLEAPPLGGDFKPEEPARGEKNGQKVSPVDDEQLAICLSGFLDEVMKKYGSLVPLSEKDVLGRLKDVFNEDFSNRKPFINREITNYRARHQKCNFRIFYNKHMLDMDDLATLDGQNWLNDQVINMYGELIMDAVPDKVHFFNSFFHRQLVTKGYNGVKRWTKKNIRKYLLTEAREKNRPEFLQGWQTAVTKCIPQQKNDSDCGVFVLQYCKCLALEQPFQFSQEDMPRVRKRIYKELCECRLLD
ncbi:sentrin-specific protease 5 isoform 1-T1 [Ctenodactylus gundi]